MDKFNQLFDITNKQLSLYRFSLPLKQAINFNGHCLNTREGLWLVEYNPDGQDYIGEISPLPGFSQETLQACQTQLTNALQTASIKPSQKNLKPPFLASVSFALFCLQQRIPWLPADAELGVDKTSPSVPLLQGELSDIVARYQSLHCPRRVKLKVARISVDEDIKIIKSLIKLNSAICLRLDANQQWTATQYLEFLTSVEAKYIDYIEEPTPCLNDNITISTQFKVAIALDESLLTTASLPINPCIKALIIKPTLIGYPERIQVLLKHAQQQQLSISISASFESPIALQQLAYLAQQWQQQTKLSISLGLDTAQAFQPNIGDRIKDNRDFQERLLSQATCLWHS